LTLINREPSAKRPLTYEISYSQITDHIYHFVFQFDGMITERLSIVDFHSHYDIFLCNNSIYTVSGTKNLCILTFERSCHDED